MASIRPALVLRTGAPLPRVHRYGSEQPVAFSPLAFAPDGKFLVGIARTDGSQAQCHIWSMLHLERPSTVLSVAADAELVFNSTSADPAQLWSSAHLRSSALKFYDRDTADGPPRFKPSIVTPDTQDNFIVGEPEATHFGPRFNDLLRASNIEGVRFFYRAHPWGHWRALLLGPQLFVQGPDPHGSSVLCVKRLQGFELTRGSPPTVQTMPAHAGEDARRWWRDQWHTHHALALEETREHHTLELNEVRMWWAHRHLLLLTRQEQRGLVLFRLNLTDRWWLPDVPLERHTLPGWDFAPEQAIISPTGGAFAIMACRSGSEGGQRPIAVDCLHPAGPVVDEEPSHLSAPHALSFSPHGTFWVGHPQEHLYVPSQQGKEQLLWALRLETDGARAQQMYRAQEPPPALSVAVSPHGEQCALQSTSQDEVMLIDGPQSWTQLAR